MPSKGRRRCTKGEAFLAKAFTHNPLYVNEKRHTGEAVKAKNENLLTRARERLFFACRCNIFDSDPQAYFVPYIQRQRI